MDDTLVCPICGNKLRNVKRDGMLFHVINKNASHIERLCNGTNHIIQIFTDEDTGVVDFVRLSLSHKYSRFLELDYYNQKCRISCWMFSQTDEKYAVQHIDIDKMIEPDFPDLAKLNERVSLYVTFS